MSKPVECIINTCQSIVSSDDLLCEAHHKVFHSVEEGRQVPTIHQMGYLIWTLGAWYNLASKKLVDGSEFIYDTHWLLSCWETDYADGNNLDFAPYRRLLEELSTLPLMAYDASTDKKLRIAEASECVASGIAWTMGHMGIVEVVPDGSVVPIRQETLHEGPGEGETYIYVLPDGWSLPREMDMGSFPVIPMEASEGRPICKLCFCNHTGEYGGEYGNCDCHYPDGMLLMEHPHDYDPDPEAVPRKTTKVPRAKDTYSPPSIRKTYVEVPRKSHRAPVITPELDKLVRATLADADQLKRRRPLVLKLRSAKASWPQSNLKEEEAVGVVISAVENDNTPQFPLGWCADCASHRTVPGEPCPYLGKANMVHMLPAPSHGPTDDY